MNSETKNFSWWDVPKAIWYFLDEDRTRFIFYFISLSIFLLYNLVPAYVAGKIVDFFISYSPGDSLRVFYLYIFFLGISYATVSIFRLACRKNIAILGPKTRARARSWGFERLAEFSLEWHNKENTGNKLQRIFTGSDSLNSCLDILSEKLTSVTVNMIATLIIFLFMDPKLVILVFFYIAIYVSIELFWSKKIYFFTNEFNKLNQSAVGVYMESASNMLSIKALGGGEGMNVRVIDKEKKSRDVAIQKQKAYYTKWNFFQLLNGLALAAFLFLVGKGFIAGTITSGTILVFFAYFIKLRDNLSDFGDLHTTLLDIRSGLAQIMPIFRETEFIKTGNDAFPQGWRTIEIKNAEMDYGSGQMGLRDFNLTLARNTKTGIAGLSGSGKSTLAKIILGLYALKSGEFKVGNRNYYSISHNETLSNITVVLQETELFNLSLRDNITMMRSSNAELLNQAIEISQLGEVINKLPEGLDSRIGEKGYMLSGGERQRLGIARAIYKNAPIVILDEATSSLDSETEGRIMERLLGEYGRDKTFLIIAHRLWTLKYTDKIAVMEEGRVVEEGSYDELMNRKDSVFHRMNKEQKNAKQN